MARIRPAATRRAALPAYHAQLALLVKNAPAGDEWIHEIKYDGYRIGCRIDGGKVRLISRNGKDWTEQFPEVVDAAKKLRVKQALLDGEVAMVLANGRTSFQALQNAFSGAARAGLVYFVFDLLHLDGEDLSSLPTTERKARLLSLVGPPRKSDRIRYSEHVAGNGAAMHREACRLGLEGIVSKRSDVPYKPGRSADWVKTKCTGEQEFVIGGFTDPEGSRKGIGALLVGYYEGERAGPKGPPLRDGRPLRFAGKVGTGFTHKVAVSLREQLDAIEQTECPFDPRPPGWLGRNAHWVKPVLVGEVKYTEWTEEGNLRHPSFQGLREDKRPEDVVRERPTAVPRTRDVGAAVRKSATVRKSDRPRERPPNPGPAPEAARSGSREIGRHEKRTTSSAKRAQPDVAGVRISNPERVVYPEVGITKLDVARFYEAIGDWIVPHVQGRPLTLVRCPKGLAEKCFYMKHSKLWAPEPLRRVNIQERTKIGEYLVADSTAGVVALAQMGVLEIHTWNSREDRVEEPDRFVMDIDPGPKIAWKEVIEAARLVRGVLETLGLRSYVKTTGGAGLHVVVPLAPQRDWSECLAFSQAVAELIVAHDPARFTTSFAKAGRERKMLIDYMRNNRTNTSVAAFSTRAKPTASVSTPIHWDELDPKLKSDHFTVKNLPKRLAQLRKDPWDGYWKSKQKISDRAMKAVTGGSED